MEIYHSKIKIAEGFIKMYWFKSIHCEKILEISYLEENNIIIMNLDDKIPYWIECNKIPLYEFVFNNLLFEKLFNEKKSINCKYSKEESKEIKTLFLMIKKELLEITGIH